ncbi:kinase-like domain-containing protein, partial [Camillea tinctor]
MSLLTSTSNLVRDSELPAEIRLDKGVYTTTHENVYRRRNSAQVWIREKKPLGSGGYGTVWLEKLRSGKDTGYHVRAVKIAKEEIREGHWEREIEALETFSQREFVHSFVNFYGWYQSEEGLHIATEYCEHGDLAEYIKNKCIPENECQDITRQVLQGLVYMHEKGFAHRDLKPGNILIKKPAPEWHVKICDMGLSKMIQGEGTKEIIGTLSFMAPERRSGTESAKRSDPFPADMWSLGEIAFNMLTGSLTFGNEDDFTTELLKRVHASDNAIKFIHSLMRITPSERLSAAKAREHPWVALTTASPDPASEAITNDKTTSSSYEGSRSWSESGNASRSQPHDLNALTAAVPSHSSTTSEEANVEDHNEGPLRWKETQKEAREELLSVLLPRLFGVKSPDRGWKETQKGAQRKLAAAAYTSLRRRID